MRHVLSNGDIPLSNTLNFPLLISTGSDHVKECQASKHAQCSPGSFAGPSFRHSRRIRRRISPKRSEQTVRCQTAQISRSGVDIYCLASRCWLNELNCRPMNPICDGFQGQDEQERSVARVRQGGWECGLARVRRGGGGREVQILEMQIDKIT